MAAALALCATSACTISSEGIGAGAAPERTTTGLTAEAAQAAAAGKTRVARVERLEVGRTGRGFVLAAFGETTGAGWSAPQLLPVTGAPAADGFVEFEFLARPPASPQDAPEGARRIRADLLFSPELLSAARGVRVLSASNTAVGAF
jgi:hypothetical protein